VRTKRSTEDRANKKRTVDAVKVMERHCGTLSYLAECRRASRKAEPLWSSPLVFVNMTVRKYPAER
jgi:hypothetical protein